MSSSSTENRGAAAPLTGVHIREGCMADAEVICVLAEQLGYPMTIAAARERLEALLVDATQTILVAQHRDRAPIGWIHAQGARPLLADPYVEIGGLVVDEKNRGRGIGKRLMAAAHEWGRARGYSAIRIRSNVKREAAHGFYRRLGYQWNKSQHVFVMNLREEH